MTAVPTSFAGTHRRHVDLVRTASATCPGTFDVPRPARSAGGPPCTRPTT
ncbi:MULTISPECIES: putative leader peptide [Actinomycetospora]